jgi:hypothetical protein
MAAVEVPRTAVVAVLLEAAAVAVDRISAVPRTAAAAAVGHISAVLLAAAAARRILRLLRVVAVDRMSAAVPGVAALRILRLQRAAAGRGLAPLHAGAAHAWSTFRALRPETSVGVKLRMDRKAAALASRLRAGAHRDKARRAAPDGLDPADRRSPAAASGSTHNKAPASATSG